MTIRPEGVKEVMQRLEDEKNAGCSLSQVMKLLSYSSTKLSNNEAPDRFFVCLGLKITEL